MCSVQYGQWAVGSGQWAVCSMQYVTRSEMDGLINVCREAGGREEYITKQNMEEALTLMRNNIVQEIR